MNSKRSVLAALFFAQMLGAACPWRLCRADSSDDDGTKKTYYWQGSQLNNLSRLGNSSAFEEEERQTREGKDKDAYLTSIRQQMAQQAKTDAQKKTALMAQGQLPGSPIELTYLSPGLRVTLHAEALFDENSAAMTNGAIDTLERLNTILDTEGQKPLQFVIADRMDDFPQAKTVDAERSLLVLTLLEMPAKDSKPGSP